MTHVGPVLRGGVLALGRDGGICTIQPLCSARGWCCSSWGFAKVDRGRAGGTAPSHSNSIPAAVLARRETPGCLYLLAVLSPLPRQLRIPSAVGRIGSAAGQHCSSACKPGSWGHCREIAPFAGPCITERGPDPYPGETWRGEDAEGLMEKSQKRGVNPSSQHTSLTSSCMDASASQHAGSVSWQSHGAPCPSPVTLWHSRAAGVGVCCIPPK